MPSKLGFGNSRKKTSSPVTMGSPMHFKNPVKMEHAMKFNAELKKAAADGKLSGKFKEVVEAAPPTKMYGSKAMKKHDPAHKMYGSKPAKMAHSPKKMAHSPKKMAHSPKKMAHSPKKMYGKKK